MKLVELACMCVLFVNIGLGSAQTCGSAGAQCYALPGSGSASSCAGINSNGCCSPACCSGLVCGGTSADNADWQGCRTNTGNTSRATKCDPSTTTAAPTTTKAPTTTATSTTTKAPSTAAPTTTKAPTTAASTTTKAPSTAAPTTTKAPSTAAPTTHAPTTTPSAATKAAITTRYYDCCKPSCAWAGKTTTASTPVDSCSASGSIIDANTQSVCASGTSYICPNQQPRNYSSTIALGFAAAVLSGGSEQTWCCACYALEFTSSPLIGKTLIVQVTNTGGDLGSDHFDLQIPGGGFGLFNGCSSQYPGNYVWGAQYGGVSSASGCSGLPAALQAGCLWRFGNWFEGADNPNVNYYRVKCPAELTAQTGCVRDDEAGYPNLIS